MKNKLCLCLLAALATFGIFAACSTVHSVRPLHKGTQAANVSLGGPLITNLGPAIPVPLLGINYLYGLTDNISVGGTAYLTDALFGTGHLELSGTWGIIDQKGAMPALSLESNLHAVSDLRTTLQFFPEVGLTPSWRLGSFLIYTGAEAMFNLYPNMANGTTREYPAIPAFYVGANWSRKHWGLAAELKYLNPWQPNFPVGPSYVGFNQWGALAPFIAFSYRFGGDL